MNGWTMRLSMCILTLPISGCFTAMSHFMGSQPSTSEKIVAGTLDVVTFPVQVVVLGPMIVSEEINANTGERGRLKRLAKERAALCDDLNADFSLVYSDPDYLSPTNTLKREALAEYFQRYGYNSLKPDDVRSLAETAASRHELAETLGPVWYRGEVSVPVRMKAVAEIEANKSSHQHPEGLIRNILSHADVSDAELERLADLRESRPLSAGEAAEILEHRRRKREADERREAERRAWQEKMRAKEEEDRRLRMEEERRQREIRQTEIMRHNEEMRRIAANIWNEDGGFAEVVENINDDIVKRAFRRTLEDADRPIPEANLKAVVDAAMKSKLKDGYLLRLVLSRRELSAATLRELYPYLIGFKPDDYTWSYSMETFMGGYIANPNLPMDILGKAWREPLLAGVRKPYFDHYVYVNLDASERQRISDEMKALYEAYGRKKDGRRELNIRLHSLMKAYLPKNPPAEWQTSIAPRTVRRMGDSTQKNKKATKEDAL